MMSMVAVRVLGSLAIVTAIFFAGYHVRGLQASAAANSLAAKQLIEANRQLTVELAHSRTLEAKITEVQGKYDAIKDLPDPVTTGLAERVRIVTVQGSCPVSGPSTGASRTQSAATLAPGDGSAQRVSELTQSVLDACAADAKQLAALEELAP